MKRALLALLAVSALAALVSPAALANWTDKGTALKGGENPHMHSTKFTITFNLPGIGHVHCAVGTVTMPITGGSPSGHWKTLSALPSSCVVSGLLKSVCGEKSVTQANLTKEATLKIEGGAIQVTNFSLQMEFGTCIALVLSNSGALTLTPDNEKEIGSLTLSGEITTEFGNGTISGSGPIEPAGTYGLE